MLAERHRPYDRGELAEVIVLATKQGVRFEEGDHPY